MLSRKRKWFPPVATVEAEGKIYELASELSDEIRNNAYNYTYARDLSEQSLKSARTNILKNKKRYMDLLSKVLGFFYQESYLQNELSFMIGGEGDNVRTDYLSLAEAWKEASQSQDLQDSSNAIALMHPSKEIRLPLKDNTYESAIELATEAHHQFVNDIEDIRKTLGFAKENVSIRKKLKSKARTDEKVQADYGGDYSRNLDYDGAMLQFESIDSAEKAWESIKDKYGDRVVKSKHISSPLGYSDYKIYLSMDNGAINEIQLLDKYMLAIKSKGIGHKLYEAWRNIDAKKNEIYEQDLRKLKKAIESWSMAEYESGKDFLENREAYTKSAARAYAISLVIKLISSWEKNQVLSSFDKGLSSIDLSSPDGISLETGSQISDSILNGISLISTYLNSSDISASTSSISDNQAFGNTSDSASASRMSLIELLTS